MVLAEAQHRADEDVGRAVVESANEVEGEVALLTMNSGSSSKTMNAFCRIGMLEAWQTVGN